MQFVPFPLMNPLHPSSVHIFFNPLHIDNLYSSLPALCTWYRILSLSSGETTVLDTAPATPPAINAAVKGEDTCSLIFHINVLAAAVVGAYSMISIYPSFSIHCHVRTSERSCISRGLDTLIPPPAAPGGVFVSSKLILKVLPSGL